MKMIKTMKKTFATSVAAVAAACTLTSFSAAAAENAPRVYVDFKYVDEDTARADVIFENFDELSLFGFKLVVGSVWEVVQDESGINYEKSLNLASIDGLFVCNTNGNEVTAALACNDNEELNGVVYSFYVNKSSHHNPSNSWIKYTSKDASFGRYVNGKYVSYTDNVDSNYRVLSAYEYLVGDVNSDSKITPVDATDLLRSYSANGVLRVYDIRYNYQQFFEDATCAATPDANQDGVIDRTDADTILNTYSMISMGVTDYEGMTGKYDYFEVYND